MQAVYDATKQEMTLTQLSHSALQLSRSVCKEALRAAHFSEITLACSTSSLPPRANKDIIFPLVTSHLELPCSLTV